MLESFSDIKHAIYINLDSRPDRRKQFEQHYTKLQQEFPNDCRFSQVHRFPAIKNELHGAIGCSKSHAQCIRIAKANNWEHVIIFEDDAVVIQPKILFDKVNCFLRDFKDNFDVLLLSGNNYTPFNMINDACCQVFNCLCCTCYIVKSHYYDTLIKNFDDGATLLSIHPNEKRIYACDSYWKQLQNVDSWYLIVPICISQRPDYSDIEKQFVNYDTLLLNYNKEQYQKSTK
jgi:GR25 family glycosyltransferase involved in LPS biosynthesis